MAKYRALRPVWVSHMSLMLKPGDEIETTFPKVKTKDGEVDMKLGDVFEVVKDGKKADDKKADKSGSDLV